VPVIQDHSSATTVHLPASYSADFAGTPFPDFGPAQIAGRVMIYRNNGCGFDQANLVMDNGSVSYKSCFGFMSRFSDIICPGCYLLNVFAEEMSLCLIETELCLVEAR